MIYTLQLPPDTQARADAEGIAVEDYLLSLIEEALPAQPREFKTGADVVTYWRENNLIGIWADHTDIKDSVEYARELRRQAETRGHD